MDVESEIRELKRRVGDLEGAVNVLTGQFGKVHPEVIALGEVAARRFDTVDRAIERMVARLDTVNTQVWALRDDLPELFASAIGKGPG